MKKIIATVLVIVMMLGLTSNAFALALTAYSTTTTSLYTTTRVKTYFKSLVGNTFTSSGSATKLTVRAYTSGGSRNSSAKTYQSGSVTGGQDYWDATVSTVDMRGNTDASGWARVSGSWEF